MKRNFYTDDFEDLIRQKADQYRMYPSEKVWKEINRSLHSRRKWYWSGFILLLSGISYFAINQLITPGANIRLAKSTTTPATESNAAAKVIPIPAFGTVPPRSASRQRSSFNETAPLQTDEAAGSSDNNTPPQVVLPYVQATLPVESSVTGLAPVFDIFTRKQVVTAEENDEPYGDLRPLMMDKIAVAAVAPEGSNAEKATNEKPSSLMDVEETQKFNWLQEFAVYELLAPKTKRTSLQFFFSPTINYRKLTGKNDADMRSDVKSIPIAMNIIGDLDGLVNHKPALGFEMGSSILYASNKNLTLKAGLQFNYSRYDIMAYSSYSAEIATIALGSQFTATTDSITNYTRIRNFGGDAKEDLKNQYFQLSVPVGLEYRLLGNDRLQVKVAGSIQPTYLINANSYLITTDYKNYTREPSLVRRWNVNTSAEAFISYQTAGVKWQIGPQFRYQLLSSYADEYPIREYLMEYGIKVGVSKTIR
jgi:hypothetical protein